MACSSEAAVAERNARYRVSKREALAAHGNEKSKENRYAISDGLPRDAGCAWVISMRIPFDQNLSKNAAWRFGGPGHVYMRTEVTSARNAITMQLKSLLKGRRVAHNKVWVSLMVEKPSGRGDAINFVDGICDALKKAVGVDDNWFSLGMVDWRIVKHEPKILITVWQESDEDVQACSYCGHIKPIKEFYKRSNLPLGYGRECLECGRLSDKARREARRNRKKPKAAP